MATTYELSLSEQSLNDLTGALLRVLQTDAGDDDELKRWHALFKRVGADRRLLRTQKTADEEAGKAHHVLIEAGYSACASGQVELPAGKTWADVDWWYVKWGTLHYALKGDETTYVQELGYIDPGDIDQKHPSEVSVYAVDEDGEHLATYPIARG